MRSATPTSGASLHQLLHGGVLAELQRKLFQRGPQQHAGGGFARLDQGGGDIDGLHADGGGDQSERDQRLDVFLVPEEIQPPFFAAEPDESISSSAGMA